MIIRTVVPALFFGIALLNGCATPMVDESSPRAAQDHQRTTVAKLLDDYVEEWLPLNALAATRFGDHRYDAIFPDNLSTDHRGKVTALHRRYLDAAATVDPSRLSEADRLSLDVFRWELTNRLALADNDDYLRPVHQLESGQTQFALLASGRGIHPFNSVQDYDNFLKRITGFSRWVDTAIANMRQGIAKGSTQPRELMEQTLPQLEAMLATDPTKTLFYQPIANLPATFGAEDRTRLTRLYTVAIQDEIVPAYRKLRDFIKVEYLPHCRGSAGLADLPDGRTQYARLARTFTTTDMTPEEIHALGLRLIGEVKAQMEKVRDQVGFKGDLRALTQYVKTDARFLPFSEDEQILAEYRRIGASIAPNVEKLFGVQPKSTFEVRATEKFRAANASAQYVVGTPDGKRKGVFYVPIMDAKKFTSIGMEQLYIHEAIPGHHFQVSLQRELSLPRFRQYVFYSAYGEGWAVYAETLGHDLGVYKDPYQYLGHLIGELRGATSLAVDTGIHSKGWSREKAIKFFLDNAIGSEELAVNRVERYMATPAQTLSYLIGEAKMHELRARAQSKLGSKFDIRAFHDEVLKDGSMPLAVLDAKMARWMAAQ